MGNQLLSIAEAAVTIGKSTQTIRRMIKGKKIKFRRKRTPQGFTYYIDKTSLLAVEGGPQPPPDIAAKVAVQTGVTAAEVETATVAGPAAPAPEATNIKVEVKPKQAEATAETLISEKDVFSLDPETVEQVQASKAGLKDLPKEKVAEGAEIEIEEIQTEEPAKVEPEVDFSHLASESDKPKKSASKKAKSDSGNQNMEQLLYFGNTLNQLINQYERLLKNQEEDKRNLFRLVETFQQRITVLETRIKQLEAPKKKWYQFWK